MPFLTIRGGIPYEELGDVADSTGAIEKEYVRTCHVAWDLRNAFIADMLADVEIGGQVQAVQDDPRLPYIDLSAWLPPAGRYHEYFLRQKLLRKNPEPHPRFPDCYAVDAKVIGGEGYPSTDGSALSFDTPNGQTALAKVRVTYKKLPWDLLDDFRPNINQGVPGFGTELLRNCSMSWRGAVEISPDRTPTTRAGAAANWEYIRVQYDAADLPSIIRTTAAPQIPINRRLQKAQFSVTWHMVPRVPRAAFRLMGHLNEAPFMLPKENVLGPGRAWLHPGSVLYLNSEAGKPYGTFGGSEVYDITYHFLYRNDGHNHFHVPGGRRPLQLYYRDPDFPSDAGLVRGPFPPLRDENLSSGDYALTGPFSSAFPFGRLDDLFRIDGGPATPNVYDFGGPGAG